MTGELKKLKIEAYKEITYDTQVDEFVVMFNPSTYSQKYEVEYKAEQGQGTTGSTQKLGKIKPQEYSFEFVFDGTGASSEEVDVADEIEWFLETCGKINSETHRPLYLRIRWGHLLSDCVLKSAEVTYNLFKPDGFPLRAKVKAVFSENIDDTLRTAEEGKNSPDLTHYRVVKEGDTLPLMTYRIYGDLSYYRDVARVNKLANFRELEVGMTLQFPPINQQGTNK
ncbi:MAG: LysM peptidoglycan-binding domain-containing protein [Deltaproteobacteria bacterium]|nr:LysM peptidoglycan-binding domain-containing protein [Deltaproteobacteria bacterium]